MTVNPIKTALIMLSCAVATTASAQDEESSSTGYVVEVAIGGEYDSNVTIDEVDLSSSQSDYGLTLDAKLGAHSAINENTELDLSYDYSQTTYNEFSLVNRKTHILGSSLDFDLGDFDSGLSFFYIHSRLDNKKFLEFYRVSPSVSGFLAKKWFARGAYVYSDKIIESNSERDAVSNSAEFDLYYFRRGLRSYFNFGFQYKHEDAQAAEFDYISGNLKLRYIHRFDLLSRVATLQLALRFEDRNYSSVTPEIRERRDDQRERWRIDLKVPVTEKAAVQFYAGYSDYESNLPRADYGQNILGTRFVYRW